MSESRYLPILQRVHGALVKAENEQIPRVTPNADIIESDEEFRIILDMPGSSKDSISIEADDLHIHILGSVKVPSQLDQSMIQGKTYARSFRLGEGVERDSISATYELGVLTIHITKSNNFKKRIINIM